MMDDDLEEAVAALQAESSATKELLKMLIVQHSVNQSPDEPTKAIDSLEVLFAEFIKLMRRDAAGPVERAHIEMMAESLASQLEGARMLATTLVQSADDEGALSN